MPHGDLGGRTLTAEPFFLVLRPEDRHAETAAVLGDMVQVRTASVVDYVPLIPNFPDLSAIQGVMITSRRAIPSPDNFPESLRAKPFYVVGAKTAVHLTAIFGITPEIVAETGRALLDRVVAAAPIHAGPLLYLRGDEVAVDVRAVLGMAHVRVVEVRMYESRPLQVLPPDLRDALQDTDLQGIIFMSRQGARVFQTLVTEGGMIGVFPRLVALCLSVPVLECLSDLPWKDKVIAPTPDMAGIRTVLGRLVGNRGGLEGK